ncbi:MAG: diaminopropionate ammonia-lyase [Woeseiaceae bacterium]
MIQDAFLVFSDSRLNHVSNSTNDKKNVSSLFSETEIKQAYKSISTWPGYRPSPLLSLAGLASVLSVRKILYKDESNRFGLGSFKALGGAFAVSQMANAKTEKPGALTVTTATDGNHGRSVAWGARQHGHRAVIYIHAEVSPGREQALKDQGAEVVRVAGNYDDSVRICYEAAAENGWDVVSDTTYDGAGHEVARTVMLGYSAMVSELVAQFGDDIPTHVFVQGGVGGLAATVCECFRVAYEDQAPRTIVVEPELAACLYESARNKAPTTVEIVNETVMAGLSCGEVSSVAWPVLRDHADDFMTISDSIVAPTMTLLRDSPFGDAPIVAGESAVAGLAGFIAARQKAGVSDALNLDDDSRILVLGTEGATDPAVYERMTGWTVDGLARSGVSGG